MKPAIVIAAYNRPDVLSRLLGSIASGIYPDDVPLVVSVDLGGARRNEVLDVANRFEWKNGPKEIIKHETHLGVNAHTLFVGSLGNRYGSIIRFEDDHYVSPLFYEYASKALEFYKEEEWFTSAAKYLVETNRFYVFPRESLSTNFGDAGIHFSKRSRYFQVPLQTRRRSFHFQTLDDCVAVYDAFQEIMPDRLSRLSPALEGYDFDTDLDGTKSASKIRHPYVITSQPCISPVRTWGLMLYPREANIVGNIPGSDLKLCRKENRRQGGLAGLVASFHQYEYARSRLSIGLKEHIIFWTMRRLSH